jgi:hypothetical protein
MAGFHHYYQRRGAEGPLSQHAVVARYGEEKSDDESVLELDLLLVVPAAVVPAYDTEESATAEFEQFGDALTWHEGFQWADTRAEKIQQYDAY